MASGQSPVNESLPKKPLLRTLAGHPGPVPPLWLMRQAGRYLPEYRAIRQQASGFLDFCFKPDLATEATLQPITRFGFDGAILFSDILVIPAALGQRVRFVEGEGPRLDPLDPSTGLTGLVPDDRLLDPVMETVRRVRAALGPDTTLIGFCGAPWTVACYMIAGRGTPDQKPALDAAAEHPAFLERLIDRLVEVSIAYLIRQIEAGAEVLQLFESHCGALPSWLRPRWSFAPMRRIVEGVRMRFPGFPMIVFARGAGADLPQLADWGVALGIDQSEPLATVLARLPADVVTQGNLDPLVLLDGGPSLDQAVRDMLAAAAGRPHIVNLGHGILPQTPIPHVERVVALVRAQDRA